MNIARKALTAIAAIALTITPVATIAAPAAHAQMSSAGSKQLVSFGDSYASNSVIPGGSRTSTPALTAAKLGMSFGDFAVSASTASPRGFTHLNAQVQAARQVGALDGNTQIVTISTGGNDAIASALGGDASWLDGDLYNNLGRAVGTIRTVAPNARIVLFGYPDVTGNGVCLTGGLMSSVNVPAHLVDLAKYREWEINERQRSVAAQLGIEFVDMKPGTAGHGLCDDANPYVARLVDTRINGATMPLHITAAGNQAMSDIIVGHIYR